MDLTLNSDEQEIVSLAQKLLDKELLLERLRLPDADLFDVRHRTLFAEQGWLGMTVDGAYGGIGLSVVDEMLLFREIGRKLGPVDSLSIALAARVAADAGNAELAQSLTAGKLGVALAVEAVRRSEGVESGQKVRAIATRGATLLLVGGADGTSLYDVSHSTIQPIPCLDKSISMGFVSMNDVPPVAHAPGPAIERASEVLAAALLLGIAEATRDMIVEYAKQRQTFGRPIGAYQGVRHPCADMAVRCEVARCQLFAAAVSLRDGGTDAGLQVDSAKVLANSAALQNVDWNIQLHGGIGVMDEYSAHFFMKRAHVLARCCGGDKALLDRIVAAPIAA